MVTRCTGHLGRRVAAVVPDPHALLGQLALLLASEPAAAARRAVVAGQVAAAGQAAALGPAEGPAALATLRVTEVAVLAPDLALRRGDKDLRAATSTSVLGVRAVDIGGRSVVMMRVVDGAAASRSRASLGVLSLQVRRTLLDSASAGDLIRNHRAPLLRYQHRRGC